MDVIDVGSQDEAMEVLGLGRDWPIRRVVNVVWLWSASVKIDSTNLRFSLSVKSAAAQ